MQKRKNRIEQWRAERRTMLGIDKVMQQSVAQAATVNKTLSKIVIKDFFKGKAWSLEDEGDEDEEDLQNVVIPSTESKRSIQAAREAAIISQADKQREALERAAQAAALASAAVANIETVEDDEEDPLEKFMETISKEVKSFRGNNATIISTKSNGNNTNAIKQVDNNKGSAIKVVTKTIKSEVSKRFHSNFSKKS
jgi:hypothetical protein